MFGFSPSLKLNCMKEEQSKEQLGYVHEFGVKNFYSIKDLRMSGLGDRREIYLLGENGDGKSLILMALVLAFKGHFIEQFTERKETGVVFDMIRANLKLVLYGKDNQGAEYKYPVSGRSSNGNGAVSLKNVLAYGVHRSRNDSDRSSSLGFMTLFDDNQYLTSPEQWLTKLYTGELERSTIKAAVRLEPISLAVAREILYNLLDKNVEIQVSSEGVKYIERGTLLQFSQLSEGYKSVITWVCDMASRLSLSNRTVEKIQDCQGVVLVDEINLHLHPKWERQIVRKLRGWFPKVQFFFTTHSPVSVLGASDDAVFYRVFKEKGETKISEPYFKSDLKDLMANNIITSPLFGLEDARMNSRDLAQVNLDTSEDFLYSRIHQKITERLAEKKKAGKVYFSPSDLDNMIEKALNEELA